MDNLTKLTYHGDVSVGIKVGDKVIYEKHNTGTNDLFKSFAKFLTGNAKLLEDTPQYLGLEHNDGTTWTSYLLSQYIKLSGSKYEFVDPNWVANFTTSITHDNLRETVIQSTGGSFRLVLYSGVIVNGERVALATLPVTVNALSQIVPGTQAIVNWTMYVGN